MTLIDFVRGRTFDDFLFTPQLGVVPSRDPAVIDLSTRFSERIPLNRSTNLDFVREKPAAVESAILSFAQKTLEMHFRRRVESICSPRASRDPQVG